MAKETSIVLTSSSRLIPGTPPVSHSRVCGSVLKSGGPPTRALVVSYELQGHPQKGPPIYSKNQSFQHRALRPIPGVPYSLGLVVACLGIREAFNWGSNYRQFSGFYPLIRGSKLPNCNQSHRYNKNLCQSIWILGFKCFLVTLS